ncbi:hypothetical protein ACFCW2_03560 [Qipengyuania sp. DSG2-2]|uniref:hypothetical protein n=1 Tax=Qipengyuania sp. DGS2-2 TaxID=3349631 RepID=UPI0036D242AC
MRILTALAASLALAAGSAPALAQSADPAPEEAVGAMADRLSDPAFQQQLSVTLATLSQVLLDLPIAPLAEAAAEMAGEEPLAVDPDMTLRKVAPDASAVPEVIEQELPRAMDRMASMAGGMEAMLPALREAARQMEQAFEGVDLR